MPIGVLNYSSQIHLRDGFLLFCFILFCLTFYSVWGKNLNNPFKMLLIEQTYLLAGVGWEDGEPP